MSATLAASLAGLSSALAVVALGRRRGHDVLGGIRSRSPRDLHARNVLARIGLWPVLRRIRVSARTIETLEGSGWDERALLGAKAISSVAVGATATALAGPILGAAASVLVYRVPDLWVARIARQRIRAVDREIPLLLDLLTVATSAGLPPQLALRRAVEAASGPLAEELTSVLNATQLGGRWRDELQAASERLGLADLRRLATTLTRAESLGSSLEVEITRLASDVREARRSAAAERARTAPVKMLFPLVFLVLPAFLLLTVVPVLVTTVRSIT